MVRCQHGPVPTPADAVACAEVLDDLTGRRAALELEVAEALDAADTYRARCAVVTAAELVALEAAEAGRLAELEADVLTP